MGLVDYDSSGSEDESPAPLSAAATPTVSSTAKKPFQKLLDGGKIRVSLPTAAASAAAAPEQPPPAKRARVGAGKFSGFNSFLPAPKNRAAAAKPPPPPPVAATGSAQRPGVNLKTGAAPAWSRAGATGDDDGSSELSKAPEIPLGMTPAEDVKIVGKPLMFAPLSVVRKQAKKKKPAAAGASAAAARPPPMAPLQKSALADPPAPQKAVGAPAQNDAPPHKVSLFSFAAAEQPVPAADATESYTPLFATAAPVYPAAAPAAAAEPSASTAAAAAAPADDLAALADTMNLSAAARRALFGRSRDAAAFASATVVNFDMEREYAHNEALRARGDEQVHNPLRAIQPGKHSLRQLIGQVQNQREALEESFAAGKNKRKEAGGRYGW